MTLHLVILTIYALRTNKLMLTTERNILRI